MLRTGRKMQGLGITVIHLAVVLLAAVAVAIAMSSRPGNASNNQQQDKLVSTTLLNEAQRLKNYVPDPEYVYYKREPGFS